MLESPEIAQAAAQLIAKIRLTIPRNEIRNAMGPGIGEVMAAAKDQGIGPAGPWFTHHLRMDPAVFDFEICVPVTAPVTATGRVAAGETPAMRVARAIYRGPYEGLGEAWGEFKRWLDANGHVTHADLYERYLAGPESSGDPAEYRTELSQPLAETS